jgi:glycerol kinase
MARYVLAIDQGTTSSRAILFDHDGAIVAVSQREHAQIFPKPGWVEHDPMEIWTNVRACMEEVMVGVATADVAAIGITNQRETTVVWDVRTGEPVCHAIVWQDTRTGEIVNRLAGDVGVHRYQQRTGLPLATYFSGPKIAWILESDPAIRADAEAGHLRFGTTDTWLIWNLTGGRSGGLHLTDVTNASRTMLMDLSTLTWDAEIAADMQVPLSLLPEIRSSSAVYGKCAYGGVLDGVVISGDLGDQQAATFGQACFAPGMAKNTYGTGCFMLLNTGTEIVPSTQGMLTTVCYQIGDQAPVYALEGSIAVAGSLVQWLRDNLGLIASAPEIETLAAGVEDNGGAYIVPAFSGLFAPHWRPDARGAIVGLTRFVTKAHLARAALEAVAFQTREVLEAMERDSGVHLRELRVDGGMIANNLLMQFQADILGVEVIAPTVAETTALGAAYAAGIAVGFWKGEGDVIANWHERSRWSPAMPADERSTRYAGWQKAVTRTLDWIE